MALPANVTPLRPKVKCPECRKASLRAYFPFCSQRCKEADLARWLTGAYVIPGPPLGDEDSGEDGQG